MTGLGKTALVIGGNRGLGNALVKSLEARGLKVYATIRGSKVPRDGSFPASVSVITGVDLLKEGAGSDEIERGLEEADKLDLVIISAGVLKSDTLETLSWKDHVEMYTAVSIAPAFIAARLSKIKAFAPGAKLLLITTEGGSIALRTSEEGGGNYGHHASKAAANMIGKLLSIDLIKQGVTVVDIHPGFMKTEMTKSVGFDEFYESGGAVEPSVAADSLLDFARDKVTPELNGKFFAPRGPRDIGQAENVMGKDLATPLELPW
ncbi:oxidoreductase [Meredithblackwellia eburnea MCA 4105]